MNIQLSDHFTYSKLFRFTVPSIVMILFISIYDVVDGFFVSNLIGSTALAAIGIIFPFWMILGAFGFMLGTGGSALVAKTLGEGDNLKANKIFSLIIYSTVITGIVLVLCGLVLLKPLLFFLGTKDNLTEICLTYGYITIPGVLFMMLQFVFQSFFITAERPKLGLFVTVLSGIINLLLDVVFIIFFHWGMAGAAWATVFSQFVGGVIPLIYFALPNSTQLHLGKTKLYFKDLLKAYSNGLSEFLTHISISIGGTLYNYQLLKNIGESGVVAYSIIGYINFIFLATFLGYNSGCAPIVSYHYGAKNYSELKNLFSKSLKLTACAGLFLFLFAEFSAPLLVKIFVSYDQNLLDLTVHSLRICAIAFLLIGFNIFASAFFTALNNGIVSAIISTVRIFVFECSCVMILPIFFGVNGIWSSITVAQILALMVSSYFLITLRHRYKYI